MDLNGETDNLSFETSRVNLLFVFTTTCSSCKENFSEWFSLARSMSNDINRRFICINAPYDIDEFVSEYDFPDKIYIPQKEIFIEKYKVSGVPLTLIIDDNGVVQYSKIGILSDSDIGEINSKINENT